MIQQEAKAFAQDLHQELNYHMTSNAQAQSLLSAERALHEESLDSHTARWQQVLDMTTKGAEEEIEQERTQNVELAVNLNDLRLELQEAEVQLKERRKRRRGDRSRDPSRHKTLFAFCSSNSSCTSQSCSVIQTFALC